MPDMDNTLDYIDNYFQGAPSPEEAQRFAQRCEADPDFAAAVAFYINARNSVSEELHAQKSAMFRERYRELSVMPAAYVPPRSLLRRLRPFITAAAACLLILLGYLFFFNRSTPEQLADKYIDREFSTLSIQMSGIMDSLQLGIAAYNREDYTTARQIFNALANEQPPDPEAVKYLGIVYLVTERYDDALAAFDRLSANRDLYVNPGLFYMALTYMKRDAPGDRAKAGQLLQKVTDLDLPGKQQASQWKKYIHP